MRKKMTYLFPFIKIVLLLASIQTNAVVDSVYCEQAFDNNGSFKVEDECLKKGLELAAISQTYQDSTLAAYKNAVFVANGNNSDKGIELLAGDQTQLDTPVALSWDQKKREIFVVLHNGDVLIYHDFVLGNVAPKKVIRNKELPGTKSITVGDEIIAFLNPSTKRIIIFDRQANSRAHGEKRKDKVIQTIELTSPADFVALAHQKDSQGTHFYLADRTSELYKLSDSGELIKLELKAASQSVTSLEYHPEKKALIIRAQSGIE